jgi:hypothetical protein
MRTIPGTFDDISRCDYDELCDEARDGIDAILSCAHGRGDARAGGADASAVHRSM